MTIAAYFYSGKKPVLDIVAIVNGRTEPLQSVPVSGRREARKLALENGATPWNF